MTPNGPCNHCGGSHGFESCPNVGRIEFENGSDEFIEAIHYLEPIVGGEEDDIKALEECPESTPEDFEYERKRHRVNRASLYALRRLTVLDKEYQNMLETLGGEMEARAKYKELLLEAHEALRMVTAGATRESLLRCCEVKYKLKALREGE